MVPSIGLTATSLTHSNWPSPVPNEPKLLMNLGAMRDLTSAITGHCIRFQEQQRQFIHFQQQNATLYYNTTTLTVKSSQFTQQLWFSLRKIRLSIQWSCLAVLGADQFACAFDCLVLDIQSKLCTKRSFVCGNAFSHKVSILIVQHTATQCINTQDHEHE